MRLVGLCLGLLAAPAAVPVEAQEWFTPEACRVTREDVAAAVMAPELAARVATVAAEVPNGVGRLWRITTPEGRVSHLWGTYHTPDPLLLDLPLPFRDILAKARVVALEFDPIPDSRAEATANADSGWMWRKEGISDWSFLPPEVLGWVEARLDSIGWGTGYLDQLSEAGLASLLLGDPCGDYLAGVLPGQDGYIAQLAYLGGAEVTGLQDWADFGRHLTEYSRREEARAIVSSYAAYLAPEEDPGLDLGSDLGADLGAARALAYRLYLEGRTAELDLWAGDWLRQLYGKEEGARIEALSEGYLLVERNLIFVDSAMPLLREGGAVIAIGAGHLAGQTGMVALLRAEGLVVERVPLPGEAP